MTTELQGVLTALVTPFAADESIDYPALGRVIDRSIDGNVDGVVVGGSTGEFASLSTAERLELVERTIDHTAGRVPVIAQTGAMTTREAIQHSQAAQSAGADVLMLVTPYYEPLSLDENVDYLRRVASSVELPIMLYNIPAATGINLPPETIRSLAEEFEHIRYIKDSSADWAQALQLIHYHGDVIKTFIGWDSYLYSALAEGATGVLAGAGNVIPEQLTGVAAALRAGDHTGAHEQWSRIYPLIDLMLNMPFGPAVKAALGILGVEAGVPRTPMATISPEQHAALSTALSGLNA
ncbi:MAG: 4-hydroxy-tetrahydrodipicolinate synthase [Micrococcaceae bacterium]